CPWILPRSTIILRLSPSIKLFILWLLFGYPICYVAIKLARLLGLWGRTPELWPGFENDPHANRYLTNVKPLRNLTEVSTKNGGWREVSDIDRERHFVDHCDFDRISVSDLSEEVFEREYRYKKPVLIHFPNGASEWTNIENWTLQALLSAYGSQEIASGRGTDFFLHLHSDYGTFRMSLENFLSTIMDSRDAHKELYYLYNKGLLNDSSGLLNTLCVPKFLQIPRDDRIPLFYLGATFSGISFHRHSDAWNGVLFGWKRWFLYPPHQTPPGGVSPGFNMMPWYEEIYPKLPQHLRPYECMQGPGDITGVLVSR
ncbi:jmjC domain-containing protein 8-like, partial [Paramacrobiotus metropolitanus]|uniref:jmjC domain-containing protein 8-like n=1 Tax=Paramacrobiotus metropolitanus TaxID=2943436 RepID=UPI0024460D73